MEDLKYKKTEELKYLSLPHNVYSKIIHSRKNDFDYILNKLN